MRGQFRGMCAMKQFNASSISEQEILAYKRKIKRQERICDVIAITIVIVVLVAIYKL